MSAPAPAPAYTGRSPWFVFRVLCLIAAVCLFISALEFSDILHGGIGLGWAWAAGGVSAFFLAWAVP
jgi:hypothetical protein